MAAVRRVGDHVHLDRRDMVDEGHQEAGEDAPVVQDQALRPDEGDGALPRRRVGRGVVGHRPELGLQEGALLRDHLGVVELDHVVAGLNDAVDHPFAAHGDLGQDEADCHPGRQA